MAGDDLDEELAQPHGGRSLRVIAIIALVVVAGALGVRALSRSEPAKAPHPTPSKTIVAQPVQPLQRVRSHSPRWCPPAGDGQTVCSTATGVPGTVLAALRERFPAAGRVMGFEEQLRDVGFGPGGLWYRAVNARQGARTITVEVHRRGASDRTHVVRSDGLVVTRVLGDFAVRVSVSGRPVISSRALLAFAGDVRLRAPG